MIKATEADDLARLIASTARAELSLIRKRKLAFESFKRDLKSYLFGVRGNPQSITDSLVSRWQSSQTDKRVKWLGPTLISLSSAVETDTDRTDPEAKRDQKAVERFRWLDVLHQQEDLHVMRRRQVTLQTYSESDEG